MKPHAGHAAMHGTTDGQSMVWDDLRVFLAIVREGSLSKAALAAGQTQPTMGRRLRALETALGQTLFQRGHRGFTLTDEGAAVLAYAERIEEQALALTRSLTGQERRLDGLLRISSSDWYGTTVLAPIIAAFSERHPAVSIDLVTDWRLYDLGRREADLVFRIQPFDEADIVQRPMGRIDYGLYIAQDAPPPPLEQRGRGLSLITLDAAYRDFPDVRWLRKHFPLARIAAGSNNRAVQARLCAAGAGLAVLPRALAAETPGIKPVEIAEAPPSRPVWMGYHRDLRRQARLKAFVDFCLALAPAAAARSEPGSTPP